MKRNRLSLPFVDWPEADRLAWLAAVGKRSVLDHPGAGAHWAETTKAAVCAAYARWLGWLACHDARSLGLKPAERVTRPAVTAYAGQLRLSVSDATVSVYLSYIAMAVRAMSPDCQFIWLNRFTARLASRAPSSGKKVGRLVASRELMDLGIRLMDHASTGGSERRRATRYRDGLMLALMALRPLRLANFIGIEIGRHLVDRGGTRWLSFEAAETKNRKALDFLFPTNLVPHLEYYLRQVRPCLCGQTTGRHPRAVFQKPGCRLWVSGTGAALRPKVFFTMTVRRTGEAFGRPVNPHLFRDCLATTLAAEEADLAWAIPHVLGHKTARTSERHYNHLLGERENQRFQQHVQTMRRSKAVPLE